MKKRDFYLAGFTMVYQNKLLRMGERSHASSPILAYNVKPASRHLQYPDPISN